MKISEQYYSLKAKSDSFLTYLNYYFESEMVFENRRTSNNVAVLYLNKYVPEGEKDRFPYPIFAFYILSEIDYLLFAVSPKLISGFGTKEPDGYLEIIETANDECAVKFSYSSNDFLPFRKQLIEHLSNLWAIKEGTLVSKNIDDLPKYKKGEDVENPNLGTFVKSIYFPKRDINISQNSLIEEPRDYLRNVAIPNKRKWDRYAIEHYNAGDTVEQISKAIKELKLGKVSAQTIFNRLTVLRKTIPGILVYHRQDFKKEK